jgi:hypothetical protein
MTTGGEGMRVLTRRAARDAEVINIEQHVLETVGGSVVGCGSGAILRRSCSSKAFVLILCAAERRTRRVLARGRSARALLGARVFHGLSCPARGGRSARGALIGGSLSAHSGGQRGPGKAWGGGRGGATQSVAAQGGVCWREVE